MTKQESKTGTTICPFMAHPRPDCYCVRSEPLYIDKVLSLCGGNFKNCEIYRNLTQEPPDRADVDS